MLWFPRVISELSLESELFSSRWFLLGLFERWFCWTSELCFVRILLLFNIWVLDGFCLVLFEWFFCWTSEFSMVFAWFCSNGCFVEHLSFLVLAGFLMVLLEWLFCWTSKLLVLIGFGCQPVSYFWCFRHTLSENVWFEYWKVINKNGQPFYTFLVILIAVMLIKPCTAWAGYLEQCILIN